MNINAAVNSITKVIADGHHNSRIDRIMEQVIVHNDLDSAAEKFIEVLEKNPEYDFGMPGSIVHFLESVCASIYPKCLLLSLQRSPTIHTIWMAHRIYNVHSAESPFFYTAIIEVLKNKTTSEQVKDFIENVLDIKDA